MQGLFLVVVLDHPGYWRSYRVISVVKWMVASMSIY